MSDTKSRFEARDVSPGGYTLSGDGERKYAGQERRRTNRRSGNDRRAEVRFDPTKQDRRRNPGRRKDDKSPKFW
ncbi:hypothetical protein [Parahaliea mediterranea]|uniref:Uncharacterized protein n=1 Tax=Parahaliea mediterranea TaxID=651086 RepID=A0A939DCS4_9GAMM|nr:hypothetical protein [Parahaliea mediterranea]MBN7795694.1 hypothetical protein [Parahaliea mediterranea]